MEEQKISGKSKISRLDFKLWREYLRITQEFWLPRDLQNVPRFITLVCFLMLFAASVLFMFVVSTEEIIFFISPDTVNSLAPGLNAWVGELLRSWVAPAATAGFLIPLIIFAVYSKKLKGYFVPWFILGTLLFLSLAVSGLNVTISYVSRFFQTALASKDAPTYWRFLYVYFGVFVVGTPLVVIYSYIRQKLGLFWRDWITTSFMDHYLKNRAYYELTANKVVDNPDQRMAEDLKQFTVTSLSFLLVILGSIIDVIAFSGILWSISKLLSGVLLVYAIGGTVLTILIGKRLVGLNYNQLRKEADFRYGLIHIRDNAESIAFYQGEAKEKAQVGKRFKSVLKNFNFLIGWQRNLDFFTTSYRYLIIVVPSAVVAPMFFDGKIEFGEISQASMAFSTVLASFSIIIHNFDGISSFAAGINRVSTFRDTLMHASGSKAVVEDFEELEHPHTDRSKIERVEENHFELHDITLQTPDYKRTLVEDLSIKLEDKDSILIVGHSGVGKSSLLRGIAGLWNSGKGKITHPQFKDVMFLPQKPYMVLGSFRDQMQYPLGIERTGAEILDALKAVNLESVYHKIQAGLPQGESIMDLELNWEDVLSQGEQQRLAFARLLLTKPKFVILDEATSALDVDNEKQLYAKLASWGVSYISVGHRPTLKDYHQRVLKVEGEGKWSIHKAADYDFHSF